MIPESEGSIFLCLARGSCLHENTTVTLKEENPELCRHYQPQVWSCSQIHRDGQGASDGALRSHTAHNSTGNLEGYHLPGVAFGFPFIMSCSLLPSPFTPLQPALPVP